MPKKPSPKPVVSASATKKQGSAPAAKKPVTKSDDVLLDEDEILADEDELDDEDIDEEELDDVEVDKEAGSDAVPSVEEEVDKIPGDDDEDEEEDPVDEEEILAKGDDLQILNLLAKKANRIEKGLDDDELIPDEEGLNSY